MTRVIVRTKDGEAEAWLAEPPKGTGDAPGVLLYMDAIGLRAQIETMADRIASWGYTVLAPNTFYRSGTAAQTSPDEDLRLPGAREAFFEHAVPRMNALTSDLSRADTNSYLDYLADTDGVVPDALGVVGYCMGVRLAIRAAGDHPDRVVSLGGFHGGGLVTDDDDSPHLSMGSARADMFFRHADNDRSMAAEHMVALAHAADQATVAGFDQDVYAGAVHGYSMADTSMHDPEAAERHFVDLEAHFARSLRI